MSGRQGPVWVAVLCVLSPAIARADILHLHNGQNLEGIIDQQSATQIRLQVAWRGFVKLPRSSVESIQPGTLAEHAALRDEWRRSFDAAQQRQQTRVELEQAQRARGLVLYRGGWITGAELAQIEEARAAQRALRAQQQQTEQLAARLSAIEQQNAALRQQLAQTPTFPTVVISRPVAVLGHPGFITDDQGNLLRLRHHEHHDFVVTSSGRHVDLSAERPDACALAQADP